MMNQAVSKFLKQDFARFLMSGGFNTALTYGIYLVLLMFLSYNISYTISYVTGILLAYVLNRFFVFKSHQGLRSVILLPLIYAIQYGLSLVILWCWVEKLQFDERLAPLAAIALTLPVTFSLSKLAFSRKDERQQ
ncbi:Putative flippase GtrA (transmembrane translocase of bactoprenol-linked glucose) [Pseudomonas syringae]|uniref:Membrane protein n=1 Tax=Pseudomonas syringae pv. apii TaxID=81036 RepID=A0A3M3R510_9PSED|nr:MULTISPECIES: GtrA family protein [Pseudomonas syringae group]RMN51787.1 Membrane protein [Pseudomonas syringae pv. apii]RMN53684.1 Membrane protein [Pseudomonas syringae pv. apii]RMN91598.1 Membrane protein [Pseudomonas syringae pv. apii]SDY36206.1 Putative flippase GtrA (transmembrane translocase of bactoprenol-linked glucose) [Pseudomonas syringae]